MTGYVYMGWGDRAGAGECPGCREMTCTQACVQYPLTRPIDRYFRVEVLNLISKGAGIRTQIFLVLKPGLFIFSWRKEYTEKKA
jgi:hypothetical protein